MTPLSQLLHTARGGAGDLTLDVPADWMQGRTAFGGLQVALALRAMRGLVADTPLRTLQATFVAPVGAAALHARARVLRSGKSATHVEAHLLDGDTAAAFLIGVFGRPRPSRVTVTPPPPVACASRPRDFVYIDGVTPAFTRHFRARWLRGSPPYSGDPALEHVVEVDLLDAGPATEAHVIAIADFIPPVALSHLRAPAPGSTLTWMLEMLVDRVDHLPLDGWRVEPSLVAARDGYTSQSVLLRGPDGGAVALSRQSMMIFD